MSHPPHLPPKTCSVPFYKRLRLVESIIFIAVFAFISGLVGGIISDTYITPEYDAYTSVIRNQQTKTKVTAPDPLFVRMHIGQTITLVTRTLYAQTEHVSPEIGISAVMLTDTGWFVAPLPASGIVARNWVAVNSEGTSYDIASLVIDGDGGVVYGFLDGNGFRVVSFPAVESLSAGTNLWAQSFGTLEARTLASPTFGTAGSDAYAPGASPYTVSLTQSAHTGSVIWTEDGKFFGFVNRDGTLLPWFVIQSVYTRVFTGVPIAHSVLPVRGHNVSLTETERTLSGYTSGFYVTSVDRSAESDVRVGDVIVSVSGTSFLPWTLDAVVALSTGERVPLVVLRDGEVVSTALQVRVQ